MCKSIQSQHSHVFNKTGAIIRHDTINRNMAVSGPSFMSKHNDEVSNIMRLLLDFMKDAWLCVQRCREENENTESESDRDIDLCEVKMTTDGYPLPPKSVVEQELNKAVSERILRAFLSQHYCESSNLGRICELYFF